jgi:hypothetical protein
MKSIIKQKITENKMPLSWKELVLHGLMNKVGEPSLVREIFRYAKKVNRDYLETEAREFHSESIGPVINIYMSALRRPLGTWGRSAEYTASVLAEETGPFHIKYNNVKKEVRWQEAERQRKVCAAMELVRLDQQFN